MKAPIVKKSTTVDKINRRNIMLTRSQAVARIADRNAKIVGVT